MLGSPSIMTTMKGSNPIDWYEKHGKEAAEGYERLDFAEVHNWLIYELPQDRNATILDVGAGSRRDAAQRVNSR